MCGVPFDVYTDRMCTTGRYDGPVQMTRQANHHERLALPRNDPKRGRAGGGGWGAVRGRVWAALSNRARQVLMTG